MLPSIATLFKFCRTQTHLHQVHSHIIHKGLEQDFNVISLLLSLSSSLSYSSSVFHRVTRPNTFLWNLLIKGYTQKSVFIEALSLVTRMKRVGEATPDKYTYPLAIKACSKERQFRTGYSFHGSVIRCGFDEDMYIGTSLIDLYGKCNEMSCAQKLFDYMRERSVKSWTALVVGYVSAGDLVEAKKVFDVMPERNLYSWNSLIGGFAKAGDLRNARRLFDEMPERDIVSYTEMIDGYAKSGDMASAKHLFQQAKNVDIVAWSALISGYAQNGQPNEALEIFLQMHSRHIKPDKFIIVSLMSACSQLGDPKWAKWVDSYLSQTSIDLHQQEVKAALIDMHAKCGNMDRASKLFENMTERDIISYSTMIKGLSMHGRGDQAVMLFNRMLSEGLVPDQVAFTVILAACSHAGLVQEGLHIFESMQKKYSMAATADHFACIVDLLSRSGRLKEAYELIKSMPVEPPISAWGALLSACNMFCDTEIGEKVAHQLFKIEPRNGGSYVLLSNSYAAVDRWSDVTDIRNIMKENGIKKICGRSWV